jgi:hypothetical protein
MISLLKGILISQLVIEDKIQILFLSCEGTDEDATVNMPRLATQAIIKIPLI